MGIHKVDNRIEVRVGEKDIVMVVAETLQGRENEATLLLAEFSKDDKENKGFPFIINGKPIEDVAQVLISCTSEEQIDKMIRMLEVQKETIREMNNKQGLVKMMEESIR